MSVVGRAILCGVLAGLVTFAVLSYFIIQDHQEAIDALVLNDEDAVLRDSIGLEYTALLHQVLNGHLEEGCISKPEEDKLMMQMDLLMAASRSGWRKAERLIRSREFQEISQ